MIRRAESSVKATLTRWSTKCLKPDVSGGAMDDWVAVNVPVWPHPRQKKTVMVLLVFRAPVSGDRPP